MSDPHHHPHRRAGPPSRLPDFALNDQFGREVVGATYAGMPLIVVVGDRDGASGVALWTSALRAVLGDTSDTHVLPIADLGGVPRLLRRMVSRLLPRDPAHWCALDWDGQVGVRIRGEREALVAAAYGADGKLRAWEALPATDVPSAALVRLVDGASA